MMNALARDRFGGCGAEGCGDRVQAVDRAMVIVVVGLLQLHLPHCLAETSTPSDYATFPAAVVVATMLGSAVAAITILRGLRAG